MNRHFLVALLLCLAVVAAGCGGNSTSDYVPGAGQARESLTLALEAWKSGQPADPAGKLPSGQTVKGIDMDWSGGRQLAAYEIGNEIPTDGSGPKKFAAKLTFKTGEILEATYYIVGIDPIQVFRDKDYERYFDAGN